MKINEIEMILNILSEKQVEELYDIVGIEPLYLSQLMKIIRDRRLNKELEKECCFMKIARKFGVSSATVYRKSKKSKQHIS
jgi:AraC-like DNA-binding protein